MLNTVSADTIIVSAGTKRYPIALSKVQNTPKNIAFLKQAWGDRECTDTTEFSGNIKTKVFYIASEGALVLVEYEKKCQTKIYSKT